MNKAQPIPDGLLVDIILNRVTQPDCKAAGFILSGFPKTSAQASALKKAGVETLIVGGIVTNGGVASTVRGAHVRGLKTLVLSDGCAAFTPQAHNAAIGSLATVSAVSTCAEAIKEIEQSESES